MVKQIKDSRKLRRDSKPISRPGKLNRKRKRTSRGSTEDD